MFNQNYNDERLEKVETVTINFETFKKALRRNFLGESNRHDRSYVLRLYPEFQAHMEAEYYESKQGRHYTNDWNEKPIHITPELLILEGNGGSFRDIINWPDEYSIRDNLTEEQIEEEGGMEECLQESREMYWDEMKIILPDKFDLGRCVTMSNNYTVDIEWEFEDSE